MPIDAAQFGQIHAFPKLVKHSDIGKLETIAQASKGSPSPIFGQQLHQQIEGMNRGEQRQQSDPEKLGS